MNLQRGKFVLIEKLLEIENLKLAFKSLSANKKRVVGIDEISIKDYEKKLEENLTKLINQVKNRKYIPKPVIQFRLRKTDSKFREIAITALEDAILQKAFIFQISPILQKQFIKNSFAYIPGKGHSKALGKILNYLQTKQYTHIASADITQFFDKIEHEKLITYFKKVVTEDEDIISLLRLWLLNGIVTNKNYHDKKIGLHQGYIISPMLSNLYLTEFDKKFTEENYVENSDFTYLR